jgi:hypothetical protein
MPIPNGKGDIRVCHEYNKDLNNREGYNSQSSHQTLYVSRKWESIRMLVEKLKNHVDVLLTKGPREQVQVGI